MSSEEQRSQPLEPPPAYTPPPPAMTARWRFIAVVALLLGGVFLLGALQEWRGYQALQRHSRHAVATLVSADLGPLKKGAQSYRVTVEYPDQDGNLHQYTFAPDYRTYLTAKGSGLMDVIYDPADPATVQLGTVADYDKFPLIAGLISLFVGMIYWHKSVRRARQLAADAAEQSGTLTSGDEEAHP